VETDPQYLQPTRFIDSDHPSLQRYAEAVTNRATTDIQKAVKIYYAIRDGWRYNAYNLDFSEDGIKASSMLERPVREGHCLDKAVLMVACLRTVNIPARLFLAKVKNHIAAERLTEALGTDELVPHGIVEVYLEGKWVKATPAFNKELCTKLNVASLEFDGRTDSLFQEFDGDGGGFMEYLEEYGHFADFPAAFALDLMRQHYPKIFQLGAVLDKNSMTEKTKES
jgi:transglutaminase-like putative cysteine protease